MLLAYRQSRLFGLQPILQTNIGRPSTGSIKSLTRVFGFLDLRSSFGVSGTLRLRPNSTSYLSQMIGRVLSQERRAPLTMLSCLTFGKCSENIGLLSGMSSTPQTARSPQVANLGREAGWGTVLAELGSRFPPACFGKETKSVLNSTFLGTRQLLTSICCGSSNRRSKQSWDTR